MRKLTLVWSLLMPGGHWESPRGEKSVWAEEVRKLQQKIVSLLFLFFLFPGVHINNAVTPVPSDFVNGNVWWKQIEYMVVNDTKDRNVIELFYSICLVLLRKLLEMWNLRPKFKFTVPTSLCYYPSLGFACVLKFENIYQILTKMSKNHLRGGEGAQCLCTWFNKL